MALFIVERVGTGFSVRSGGWIALADVLRTDAASLVFGDTFSIDAATPGSITKGGSQGLLPLVRTNTLKVG